MEMGVATICCKTCLRLTQISVFFLDPEGGSQKATLLVVVVLPACHGTQLVERSDEYLYTGGAYCNESRVSKQAGVFQVQ